VRVGHFYHLYADGSWEKAAAEHAAALRWSAFTGNIAVGIVGEKQRRAAARRWLAREFGPCEIAAEADTGFEQVTIRALHDWALTQQDEAAVLYAHTKGAANHSKHNDLWRQSMTNWVVSEWRDCVKLLSDHDAVGCHWLTTGEYGDRLPGDMFGGNFWWARASYLASLPPVDDTNRHMAETWLALGDPVIYDLRPGWPTQELLTSS